jgi:hypothetical protein
MLCMALVPSLLGGFYLLLFQQWTPSPWSVVIKVSISEQLFQFLELVFDYSFFNSSQRC